LGRKQYLSMVASITLLVVLDSLCVADSAGRRSRGCAWRLLCYLVAAAILVYDLGAHVGEGRRTGKARSHGGGAPSVTAWEGARAFERKAGWEPGCADWLAAGSSFFLQTTVGGSSKTTMRSTAQRDKGALFVREGDCGSNVGGRLGGDGTKGQQQGGCMYLEALSSRGRGEMWVRNWSERSKGMERAAKRVL
jgi:hypothetical protein